MGSAWYVESTMIKYHLPPDNNDTTRKFPRTLDDAFGLHYPPPVEKKSPNLVDLALSAFAAFLLYALVAGFLHYAGL
jgi:hypothetical protein